MEIWLAVIVLTGGLFYAVISGRRTEKRKREKYIREKFGRNPFQKDEIKKSISNYFETYTDGLYIDAVTWDDLNMDDIFSRINNCDSSAGEELLYTQLHNTMRDEGEDALLERRIAFAQDDEERQKLEKLLWDYGKRETSYFIPSYLQMAKDFTIKNVWIYRMMQILLGIAIIAALFLHNVLGIAILVTMFCINIAVYIISVKFKYDEQIQMLGDIVYLLTIAGKIQRQFADKGICDELSAYLQHFAGIDKKAFLLMMQNNRKNGDAFEMLQDMLLGATMWHILTYNKLMLYLYEEIESYMEIYRIIGELDAAVSIASFRKSMKQTAIPNITGERRMEAVAVYHPLLENPVCNSITLEHNCIVTGSNASGKSTFIKTIAVNVLLAQSIHTCMAERMLLPHAVLITSMAVKDDILSGDSYFMKEIKYLKRIIDHISPEQTVICVIDEILRGTNTQERVAASKAIMEYLAERNCIVIVASHDKELTMLEKAGYDNYHFTERFGEADVVFDYKLQRGPAESQNAIRLLEVSQFPTAIINRAQQIVKENA